MTPEFASFLGVVLVVVALVCVILVYRAVLTASRELTAIRRHLDRLAPEAILHLKTERRGGAGQPAPKD